MLILVVQNVTTQYNSHYMEHCWYIIIYWHTSNIPNNWCYDLYNIMSCLIGYLMLPNMYFVHWRLLQLFASHKMVLLVRLVKTLSIRTQPYKLYIPIPYGILNYVNTHAPKFPHKCYYKILFKGDVVLWEKLHYSIWTKHLRS